MPGDPVPANGASGGNRRSVRWERKRYVSRSVFRKGIPQWVNRKAGHGVSTTCFGVRWLVITEHRKYDLFSTVCEHLDGSTERDLWSVNHGMRQVLTDPNKPYVDRMWTVGRMEALQGRLQTQMQPSIRSVILDVRGMSGEQRTALTSLARAVGGSVNELVVIGKESASVDEDEYMLGGEPENNWPNLQFGDLSAIRTLHVDVRYSPAIPEPLFETYCTPQAAETVFPSVFVAWVCGGSEYFKRRPTSNG